MKKRLSILAIGLLSLLNATNITSNKNIYSSQEKILLKVSEMAGNQKDWIGIYPENASTDWENVLKWTWTKGKINHTFTFQELPKGNYEARAFFNNSYVVEASHKFKVKNENPLAPAELNSQKASYTAHENIFIESKNMAGNQKDWIGIYTVGASNEWNNVLRWTWTKSKINDTFRFKGLPKGEYEARAFFNNSYKVEALTKFSVKDGNHIPATIKTEKEVYKTNEKVQVVVNNMLGDKKDWIGIFSKNSSSEWKNVIRWSWTNGEESTSINFKPLKAGVYEARAFFKNSYKIEAKANFTVETVVPNNDKIVQHVKNTCINNKKDKNIVCLEEFNIAYYRIKDNDINEEILYAINTTDNWSRIGKTYLNFTSNPQITKLANTPLLKVTTFGHHLIKYNFYYTDINNKSIKNLLTYTKEDNWLVDEIKTISNGKKLSIKAHHNGSGEKYYKLYDISNLPTITLIN